MLGVAKVAVAMVACLSLCGCIATAQKIHGYDGQQYTRIDCSGSAVPMSVCYDKANEVCPRGYFLMGEDQRPMGAFGTSTMYGTVVTTNVSKSIVVGCK
jgi:hypothetical protein